MTIDSNSQGITLARPVAVSLRVVNLNGTGDHSILDLNPGFFVNQLSWSPTGEQLAFDIGTSPVPQPLQGPSLAAIHATLEVYLVNSDGTGLTRLRGPGAGLPTWSPTEGTPPIQMPAIIQTRLPNGEWKLAWPISAGPLVLQSTASLNSGIGWAEVPAEQLQTENEMRTIVISTTDEVRFFRLVKS